jgi:hypothetical protein
MRKVLDTMSATTVNELIDALEIMVADHLAPDNTFLDCTYVTINSDSVRCTLVEETLTDGSKVYNIELTEVSK